MEEKLKAGDVVSLKSDEANALLMTVECIENPDAANPVAQCIWGFQGYVNSKMISVAALKKVK